MGNRKGWWGVGARKHLVMFPYGPPVWYWPPSAPPNLSSITGGKMDGAQLAYARHLFGIGWLRTDVRWLRGELSGGELDESRKIARKAIMR